MVPKASPRTELRSDSRAIRACGDSESVICARQRRDDGLVDAVTHAALGHRDVRAPGDRLAQRRIPLRPVGRHEEAPDDLGDVEVLDRITDRDALLRRVAAGPHVEGDRPRLAGALREQVVGVRRAIDPLHRREDRAVVDHPEPPVAPLLEQPVRLLGVDLAAEEQRELSLLVPGAVPLEAPGEVLEELVGDAAIDHRLGQGLAGIDLDVAHELRPLSIDHHQAADLADVRPRPDQLGVLHHRGLAAARLDHHLDVGAVTGLQRASLEHRELPLGVAEERAPAAEQGPVEVGVEAAERHHGGQPYPAASYR